MALSDYVADRAEIAFKGGSFFVKGLTLVEVSSLIKHHFGEMEKAFSVFESVTSGTPSTEVEGKLILNLVRDLPQLAASIIACASDEETVEREALIKTASKLSMPLQVEALQKIGELTFADAGGPKNFFAALGTLIKGMIPSSLRDAATMNQN